MIQGSARASKILASHLVWDNHGCMPMRADARFLPQLERYRKAGANVVSINVGFAEMSWAEHLHILSFMRQWVAQRADEYILVRTVKDVRRCKPENKLGVVFDIEGMYPVQHNLNFVQTFHELGIRWMAIAYNRNNAAGGGCMDADPGLSDVGRAIIDEMERVGMVLCLSHSGKRTVADAIEYARNPSIFSHSNPHGDTPHVRNVSDDLIKACASKGGVIGLSGIGLFLGGQDDLVTHYLRQLRYLIDLVGPQHVGLGLDYVFNRSELAENVRLNPERYPPDARNALAMIGPEALHEIVDALAGDNLTDAQIAGILGENWLRVAANVWR
jgi:membrane dipeptidase